MCRPPYPCLQAHTIQATPKVQAERDKERKSEFSILLYSWSSSSNGCVPNSGTSNKLKEHTQPDITIKVVIFILTSLVLNNK